MLLGLVRELVVVSVDPMQVVQHVVHAEEIAELFGVTRLSEYRISHLSDNVVLLEFLRGWQQSGTVGQEVYGAGISLTYAASHHLPVNATTILFCDYPITDVKETTRGKRRSVSFRIAGDKKGRCSLRLLPRGAEPMSSDTRLRKSTRAGWVEQDSERSDEGHRLFSARDQDRFVLSIKG